MGKMPAWGNMICNKAEEYYGIMLYYAYSLLAPAVHYWASICLSVAL